MISNIILCSDIHIFPYKRHAEYRAVFNKLFDYIRTNKDDDSVICLGGDIVNNKTDITPELVSLLTEFLRECADLCPTILILGNHDYSTNLSRLDPLSPIIEALNHPNLHFWKNSGIYELNEVHFSVFSLLGDKSEWVLANQVPGKHKIAIFHGPVISEHNVDSHIAQSSRAVPVEIFDGFDLVLLGDLHLAHYCNKQKTIGYPSSLLQQGHGEPANGHGILVWDVAKRKSKFVEIKNDYCYYTLNIKNDFYSIPKNLPPKVRLKIKYENTSPETVNEAIEEFGKNYTILEKTKYPIRTTGTISNKNTTLGNSWDINYQNILIEEYLKYKNIDSELIKEVQSINFLVNAATNFNAVNRNIVWVPKLLKFSNMFSYGEDNEIDLSDYEGLYGIVAGNFQGKSALLDILCFSIYDKSTRATKASHILNNNKTWFKCHFSFEYSGKLYFIERFGQKNEKTGAVRVDVKFWTIDEFGNEIPLNGDDRDQTNKAIREMLGTYDDFVMTALSTQYDNQSFVDKSQKERKELLYKFLDISVYDELYKIAKETNRDQQVLLKELDLENLQVKLTDVIKGLGESENKSIKLNNLIQTTKQTIEQTNEELFELNKQLQNIDNSLNIDEIESNVFKIEKEINDITLESDNLIITLKSNITEYEKLESELDGVDIEGIISDKSLEIEQKELSQKSREIGAKITSLGFEIDSHKKKVKHLEGHEYDPTCEFCCKNQFVIDAKLSADLLPELESQMLFQMSENSMVESAWLVWNLENKKRNDSVDTIHKFKYLQNQINLQTNKQETLSSKIDSLSERLKSFNDLTRKYYENEEIIKKNNELSIYIQYYKKSLVEWSEKLDKLETEYRNLFSYISAQNTQKELLEGKIARQRELLKNSHIYDLYTQCMGRDGIPYLILEKVMPVIEYEVNDVLNKVVGFTVRMESTDERYVHAFIDYGDEQTWPIELTSGMERFILSLAFRSALAEITSLSRPNFFAIDEGFGVLDSDNLIAMQKMFDFLRTRYSYLLIVSHIDMMKDLIEKKIHIQKVDGYSTIIHND